MDLQFRPLIRQFASQSQVGRIVTEAWTAAHVFCPACPAPALNAYPANYPVADFFCTSCHNAFQLKSKRGRFGPVVANSAFHKKMEAIKENRLPSYLFLAHDGQLVTDLFAIPGFLVLPEFIQRRNPLSPTARRAGWVGSNILLREISPIAQIRLVKGGNTIDPAEVRKQWRRVSFLRDKPLESRGWTADVLAQIQRFPSREFHLRDLYARREVLQARHPENTFIEPKIRQQVQLLRDRGVLTSLGRGVYRLR